MVSLMKALLAELDQAVETAGRVSSSVGSDFHYIQR